VHEHKLTTQPTYQAEHVLARDHGVCEACGIDCLQLARDGQALIDAKNKSTTANLMANLAAIEDFVQRHGIAAHMMDRYWVRRRFWEMDHRVPVVEGGGGCGLDNLRTLCWRCHKTETVALAKRRAAARKDI
jgi:hypothetical protein